MTTKMLLTGIGAAVLSAVVAVLVMKMLGLESATGGAIGGAVGGVTCALIASASTKKKEENDS